MNDKTQAERVAELQKRHDTEIGFRTANDIDNIWYNKWKECDSDRGELLEMVGAEDRPQYCICNKHPWLTAIHRRATFECPACRAEAAEATIKAIGELPDKWHTDFKLWNVESDANQCIKDVQSILKGVSDDNTQKNKPKSPALPG